MCRAGVSRDRMGAESWAPRQLLQAQRGAGRAGDPWRQAQGQLTPSDAHQQRPVLGSKCRPRAGALGPHGSTLEVIPPPSLSPASKGPLSAVTALRHFLVTAE